MINIIMFRLPCRRLDIRLTEEIENECLLLTMKSNPCFLLLEQLIEGLVKFRFFAYDDLVYIAFWMDDKLGWKTF